MERTYKFNLIKDAGLYLMYGLVFFLCAMATSCKDRNKDHDEKISLYWTDGRAIGIVIPKYLIKDYSELHAEHTIKVMLSGSKQSVFGNFVRINDIVVFEPLIPLSPGLSYDVWQDGKLIGTREVPQSGDGAPRVLAIYPEKDTVPENLLKMYLHFSKPMRTGNSLDHIVLLDKNRDTMRNVFLNLQPELWDTSGTVLTVWLDPGRIKRGLVLNQKFGNPLKKDGAYQLVISKDWKDSRGISLDQNYTKNFVAGARDEQVPDIKSWQLNILKAGTAMPLVVDTRVATDHYLLQESVTVLDGDGKAVKGTIEVAGKDQLWKFTPTEAWRAGNYRLYVKARLEDLAGNNLNRVFDRDITKDKQTNKEYFERYFVVVR